MRKSRYLLLLALLGATLHPSAGLAQTDAERSAARAAAEQGSEAFDNHDWARAVEYFQKAQALVGAPTHLLFIARAEEKQGHLVEAREAYIKIERFELGDRPPPAFVTAKREAEAERPGVEARLPYVTVNVSGGAPTKLTIDGKELPGNLAGVSAPINPGEHTFQAFGDGLESLTVTQAIAEGERKTVQLELVPSATPAEPPPEPAPAQPVQDTPPADQPMDQGISQSTMKIGAYVALGVGAVGLGLGTVFLLQRSSKQGDADDAYKAFEADGCVTERSSDCQSQASKIAELDDSAATAGTISVISFGVGAAAAITGATLLLMNSGSDQAATPGLMPYASFDSVGVTGSF